MSRRIVKSAYFHLSPNLVPVPEMDWNKVSDERQARLRLLTDAVNATRDAIVADESYDEDTFPESFDVLGFCRAAMKGHRADSHEVLMFRRAMTVLTTVTKMKLPEGFALIDDDAHSAAMLLSQLANAEYQKQQQEKMHKNPSIQEALKTAATKIDGNQLVDDVLKGNTTYDKDVEYMKSGLVVSKDDVEVTSLDKMDEVKAKLDAEANQ